MKKVYIVSAVRTPFGSFGGVFKTLSAVDLGAAAIKGGLKKANVNPNDVEEVFMGNVVSGNLGQAPARQAALAAGISNTVPCTTVNKVCSSGMKAAMFGAQSIMLGLKDIVVVGGMESMTNIPYYSPDARWGRKYGDAKLVDGLAKDGLTDAYGKMPMGVCADATATKFDVSREAQDEFSINSYKRVAAATDNGDFSDEIIAVTVPQRRGDDLVVTVDEEYKKVKFEKIPSLRAVFTKDGTVTAANASTINDGASVLVLASEEAVKKHNLKPVGEIVAFADAAHAPEWFTTAPPKAAKKALAMAGLDIADIDYFEVNEAFAVVSMVFAKEFGISYDKMNVFGGAVAMGHPLGASGARIVTTLNSVLHNKNGKYGLAAICNGGGGASAMIIKRV